MIVEGRTVELFGPRQGGAPLVVLSAGMDEGGAVYEAVREKTDVDFALASITIPDWDADLTPWPAPAIARGAAPCAGGADAWLALLTERVLPRIEASLPAKPAYAALCGYSLGGLFALYAMYRTDAFARIASASGSAWYPGFAEFAQTHGPVRKPDCVYLSLGDRESRSKNPVLRTVEDNTRLLARHYAQMGIPSTLEMNSGGHFQDENPRVARAIAWLLEADLSR